MTLSEISATYKRLLDAEETTREKLAKARADLTTAREADVQAGAEAALAGKPQPKRSEVRLRHAIENLEVQGQAIDAAHKSLLEEAITSVGEGRRPLVKPGKVRPQRALSQRAEYTPAPDESELRELRNRIMPRLTDEQRRDAWAESGQPAPVDIRPDDIVAFVTAAYDTADRLHAEKAEQRRKAKGYEVAIRHVQDAKVEHQRRGKDLRSFEMRQYPEIVTEEDLSFFWKDLPPDGHIERPPEGEQFHPGSLQDNRANDEPHRPLPAQED
jgi:hypothetical protein